MSKIVLGSFLGVGLLRAGVNLYVSIDGKWMRLCEKRMGNCKYLDLIKSIGPWGACLFSIDGNINICPHPALDDPIDNIPATGGLMVMSSLMALLSLAIVATVILSTYLGYWADGFKKNLAVGIAGVLMLLSGLFELIVTVWITTAAYRSGEMMANRPPLYFAWVGVFLSFLPGAIVTSDYLWKECCPCQVEPEEEEESNFVVSLPMMPTLKPNRVVKPCPEMMEVDVYTGRPVMVKPKVDSPPKRVEPNVGSAKMVEWVVDTGMPVMVKPKVDSHPKRAEPDVGSAKMVEWDVGTGMPVMVKPKVDSYPKRVEPNVGSAYPKILESNVDTGMPVMVKPKVDSHPKRVEPNVGSAKMVEWDVDTGMPVMVELNVDTYPEMVESNLVWNYGNGNYISD
ncbi:uncharacterized protein LOC144031939 [Festucalex cinctus]